MNTRTRKYTRRFVAGGICFVLALGCLGGSAANAEEWGDIKGSFVFEGDIPAASKIKVDKDAAVCGVHNLVDESLVVNAENKGIANVILYLYLGKKDNLRPFTNPTRKRKPPKSLSTMRIVSLALESHSFARHKHF